MSDYKLATKMTDEELQQQAPTIYTLAKKLDPFLEQYGLANHIASVALLIDASGSMRELFQRGKVQTLVERMLPFGVRFDDNATIDAWLFSSMVSKLHEITPANFQGCVDRMRWNQYMSTTNYEAAIDVVINHYGRQTPREHPVYLIFVTDGEPSGYKRDAINKIAQLAKLGIFTQFVAIGEDWPRGDDLTPNQTFSQQPKKKGFFAKLFGSDDSSSGPQPRTSGMRFLVEMDEELDVEVDSANAFAVTDPATVREDRLYSLMTREYPIWLPQAKQAGLIQ